MKTPTPDAASHSAIFVIAVTAMTAMAAIPIMPASATAAQVRDVVDTAAIAEAPAAEWLSNGRDYEETRYSPLDQIDVDSIDRLELAWTYDTAATGNLEASPLISGGVLYATTTWSNVFALDAATGEELWRWDAGIPQTNGPSLCCGPVNRGVALYNGKVYAGLLDGRLVALDAVTGRVVWSAQTTTPGLDYSITGAPRVVKGKVIIGNGGAEFGVRGYVTAYDSQTGDQAWRFYTVPGNPADGFENEAMERAAETWSGEWWALGGGGTAWDAFAYDPEEDLLYVGTGNGSPWTQSIRSPGGGDNLYLSSILALDPDTGDLVWYYQTTPGEEWDYTAVQPIILADLTIEGRERKVLMQAPKNGFFYVIDRVTGAFISAEAYAEVTWAEGIDPETGRPIEAANARYGRTDGEWLSPGPFGAHNWHGMSWNPNTGLVYIPGQNNNNYYAINTAFEAQAGRSNTGLVGRGGTPEGFVRPPAPPMENPGAFFLAWDPVAQEERWRVITGGFSNGGTMTTAGNLLFAGHGNGNLQAYNATTGELLWERMTAGGVGQPVTYELDGRQYVSVMAGRGGNTPSAVWTFTIDD